MNIVEGIVVFIMVWWLVLFMVLPFGVRSTQTVQKGNDHGAPQKTHLKIKLIVTTIIALVLTLAYAWILKEGYLDFLKIRDSWQ